MNPTIRILLHAIITFVALLMFARMLGKKQVSQLTFFNYVSGITFGSIAGTCTLDPNLSLAQGLTGLFTWAAMAWLSGYVSLKSKRLRKIIDSEPTIIIKHGQILDKSLAGARLNINDMLMLLRRKNIFSVQEVEYAILEPDGNISVLKKAEHQGVTKHDLQLAKANAPILPTEVVIEGQLLHRNLRELGLNKQWLDEQLKQNGIHSLQQIFFAQLQPDGTLYVDKYGDVVH